MMSEPSIAAACRGLVHLIESVCIKYMRTRAEATGDSVVPAGTIGSKSFSSYASYIEEELSKDPISLDTIIKNLCSGSYDLLNNLCEVGQKLELWPKVYLDKIGSSITIGVTIHVRRKETSI